MPNSIFMFVLQSWTKKNIIKCSKWLKKTLLSHPDFISFLCGTERTLRDVRMTYLCYQPTQLWPTWWPTHSNYRNHGTSSVTQYQRCGSSSYLSITTSAQTTTKGWAMNIKNEWHQHDAQILLDNGNLILIFLLFFFLLAPSIIVPRGNDPSNVAQTCLYEACLWSPGHRYSWSLLPDSSTTTNLFCRWYYPGSI